MADSYVIIGDGIAGATAAETIRREGDDADITVLTDESEPLYNRIMLKSYMKGQLPLKYTRVHDRDWYEKRDIELRLETRVEKVDVDAKKVETEDDGSCGYDKLLVATGGSPRKFPAGKDYSNLFYMWTMGDAERIKEAAEGSEEAVVIGGGLLGIDLAMAYAENDAEVDYLIREGNWWSRGLDLEGANLIHQRLEEKGVNVVTDTEVEDFESRNGEITAAVSTSGDTFQCDSVAVAIGQEPNSSIINVEKNEKGMIKTDKYLQTSYPDVFAAGNMVEYRSTVFQCRLHNGSWDHSDAMGRTAGKNMLGKEEEFDYVNTYGVGHFDIQFLAIGDWNAEPVSRRYGEDEYRRLFFRDNRLVGAVLIGFTKGQEELRKMVKEREEVSDKEELLERDYW